MALLGEPLLHFTLIGVALFFFYGQPGASKLPPKLDDDVISVRPETVSRMSSQFAGTWNRSPTEEELASLIESYVREEVLYREALALGLDEGDSVIRQRLRLKMEFIGESVAATMDPDEAVLAAWYADNAAQFTPAARISLQQVLLASPEEAEAVRAALSAGRELETLGQSTMLPASVEAGSPTTIDGTFGPGFFSTVAALPLGEWQGPVKSAYGWHVVALTAVQQPETPPLASVREIVLAAWRQAQAEALREAQYQALRARYEIRLSEAPE